MKVKIHEANGNFCFVEYELESDNEDTLISDYLRVLGKLRLGHSQVEESGFTGQETASDKQLSTIKRIAKEQEKDLSTITEYIAKKYRKPSLPNITKTEASDILDILMKGAKDA